MVIGILVQIYAIYANQLLLDPKGDVVEAGGTLIPLFGETNQPEDKPTLDNQRLISFVLLGISVVLAIASVFKKVWLLVILSAFITFGVNFYWLLLGSESLSKGPMYGITVKYSLAASVIYLFSCFIPVNGYPCCRTKNDENHVQTSQHQQAPV